MLRWPTEWHQPSGWGANAAAMRRADHYPDVRRGLLGGMYAACVCGWVGARGSGKHLDTVCVAWRKHFDSFSWQDADSVEMESVDSYPDKVCRRHALVDSVWSTTEGQEILVFRRCRKCGYVWT